MFAIEVQLEVKQGDATTQSWYRLSTHGATVFQGYESDLTPEMRSVVGQIIRTHGDVQSSIGARLIRN